MNKPLEFVDLCIYLLQLCNLCSAVPAEFSKPHLPWICDVANLSRSESLHWKKNSPDNMLSITYEFSLLPNSLCHNK